MTVCKITNLWWISGPIIISYLRDDIGPNVFLKAQVDVIEADLKCLEAHSSQQRTKTLLIWNKITLSCDKDSWWQFVNLFSFFFYYAHLLITLPLAGNQTCNPYSVVLLRHRTQYLVDLQDFSPLLGGRAALASWAVLVFGAVIFHKGYQLLDGTANKNLALLFTVSKTTVIESLSKCWHIQLN